MSYPYLTFASPIGGKETFFLPDTTDAERYARELAPDIWRQRQIIRMAYADQSLGELTVLIPRSAIPNDEVARDINGGLIIGMRMKIVDSIEEPMIAFTLKRTALP